MINNVYLSLFWYKEVNSTQEKLLSNFISPELNQRISKIIGKQVRNRSTISKVMLYHELDRLFNMGCPLKYPLIYGKKGSLLIKGVSVKCSISYHKELISVAICPSAGIGIDIEELSRNNRFSMLPNGIRKRLIGLSITKWNELEAYSKYMNEGLSIVFVKTLENPSNIEFKHIKINSNIDCCIVSQKKIRLQQQFLTLESLIAFMKKIKNDRNKNISICPTTLTT